MRQPDFAESTATDVGAVMGIASASAPSGLNTFTALPPRSAT